MTINFLEPMDDPPPEKKKIDSIILGIRALTGPVAPLQPMALDATKVNSIPKTTEELKKQVVNPDRPLGQVTPHEVQARQDLANRTGVLAPSTQPAKFKPDDKEIASDPDRLDAVMSLLPSHLRGKVEHLVRGVMQTTPAIVASTAVGTAKDFMGPDPAGWINGPSQGIHAITGLPAARKLVSENPEQARNLLKYITERLGTLAKGSSEEGAFRGAAAHLEAAFAGRAKPTQDLSKVLTTAKEPHKLSTQLRATARKIPQIDDLETATMYTSIDHEFAKRELPFLADHIDRHGVDKTVAMIEGPNSPYTAHQREVLGTLIEDPKAGLAKLDPAEEKHAVTVLGQARDSQAYDMLSKAKGVVEHISIDPAFDIKAHSALQKVARGEMAADDFINQFGVHLSPERRPEFEQKVQDFLASHAEMTKRDEAYLNAATSPKTRDVENTKDQLFSAIHKHLTKGWDQAEVEDGGGILFSLARDFESMPPSEVVAKYAPDDPEVKKILERLGEGELPPERFYTGEGEFTFGVHQLDAEHPDFVDHVAKTVNQARRTLGDDLGGGSPVDLILDNSNASSEQVKRAIKEAEGRGLIKPRSGPDNLMSQAETVGMDIDKRAAANKAQKYSGNISEVVTRETVQNSIDATRAAVRAGKIDHGQVDVYIDTQKHLFTIKDNGIGMTPETIKGPFLSLYGSLKLGLKDTEAMGSYGLAKAAMLGNAEEIRVISIAEKDGKKIRSTLTGEGEHAWADGKMNLESVEVDPSTPTGTTIQLKVKNKAEKPTEWERAKSYLNGLSEKSLVDDVDVNMKIDNVEATVVDYLAEYDWEKGGYPSTRVGINKQAQKRVLQNYEEPFEIDTPSATVTIYPGKGKSGHGYTTSHVMNQGAFQFSRQESLGIPGLPRESLVNVKPKVNANHEDYPFTMTRDQLRGSTLDAIQNFYQQLGAKEQQKEATTLIKSATTAPQIGKSAFRVFATSDATPAELAEHISKQKYIQNINPFYSEVVNEIFSKIYQGTSIYRGGTLSSPRFGGIGLGDNYLGVNINISGLVSSAKDAGVDPQKIIDLANNDMRNVILFNPYVAAKELISSGVNLTPETLTAQTMGVAVHEIIHQAARSHDKDFVAVWTRVLDDYVGKYPELRAMILKENKKMLDDPQFGRDYDMLIDAWNQKKPGTKDMFRKFIGHGGDEDDWIIRREP